MKDNTKISIMVITYNHENYIAKALESILMQETIYAYEVIIGEDCSTDHTMDVIMKYQKRFGKKMHLLTRQKNVGMMRNVLECLNYCKGEYIAFLEGDDYWTDPHKLQTQVDYMEKHNACILTSHGWMIVDREERIVSKDHMSPERHVYDFEQFVSYELPGQASTWMVRNEIDKIRKECMPLLKKYFWIVPDRSITFVLLLYGEIHILPENMSAYRYVIEKDGQNWSSKHDVEARHNFISISIQMIGLEHMAKKKNITLDFYETRKYVLKKSRKYYRETHNKWIWLQGVILLLLEPKKIRLLKELFHA